MNYHALAPKRYKRSVVSGVEHRIHRACSTWQHFHDSLEKAKRILKRNQYPPTFYEPIIKKTLDTIIGTEHKPEEPSSESILKTKKYPLINQYRGKCTEDYARALHRYNAPCIIMTLRKLKTVLPSLKPPVEKIFKSGIVYKLTCPSCLVCYVGQTSRHYANSLQRTHKNTGTNAIPPATV